MFSRPSRLATIVERTSAEKPDAILVAGDFIDDDPYFVPKFLRAFAAAPAELPVYAVLGNHEIYVNPGGVVAEMRRQSRVRLLVNEGVPLARGGSALWLAGISDYAASENYAREFRPDVSAALRGKPPSAVPILLGHQPKGFGDAKKAEIPLTLSGHSHGGQCGIRALNWSLAGMFIPYHMGLYREGAHQLFVSTGAGYWLVPFRLGISPEIVVMELKAAP
jgi:predicted MPP superfamily phosphohydrolase